MMTSAEGDWLVAKVLEAVRAETIEDQLMVVGLVTSELMHRFPTDIREDRMESWVRALFAAENAMAEHDLMSI